MLMFFCVTLCFEEILIHNSQRFMIKNVAKSVELVLSPAKSWTGLGNLRFLQVK
jgi:hypothetical protein